MRAAVDADLGAGDERSVVGGDHCDHGRDSAGVAEDFALLPCSSGVCLVQRPRSYPSGILSRVLLANAVDTPPGWMLTARSPCFEYSSASEWVSAMMPPLLAAYAAMYGCAKVAAVEVKLTTTPRPESMSAGSAARVIRNVPVRLIARVVFQSWSVCS